MQQFFERPPLQTHNAYLTILLQQGTGSELASVKDYALRTGLRVDEVLEAIDPLLQVGALSIEIVGDNIFIHTAPSGRPAPPGVPQARPNLWEVLRSSNDLMLAHALWVLMKDLEAAGWRVSYDKARVRQGLGYIPTPPELGVIFGTGDASDDKVVPLLPFPDPTYLSARGGPLANYEAAGAGAVAVTCKMGQLDSCASKTRKWMLSRVTPPRMNVFILEMPNYNPVLLSPADNSIRPRSVTRQEIGF